MREMRQLIGAGALLTAVLLNSSGCQRPRGPAATEEQAKEWPSNKAEGGHAHDHPDEGPHHGALVEWGDEKYHAEFTVDHAKKLATVYILDGTAKKAAPIAVESITLTLTNVSPAIHVMTLKADPQEGDPKGQSSRFTGTAAPLGKEMEFEGEISGKVGDTNYAGTFKEKEHEDGHKHEKN